MLSAIGWLVGIWCRLLWEKRSEMNEWWCYLFGRGSHFPLLEAAITLAFTIVLSPPNGMTSHTTTTATAHGTHDDE